MLKKEEVKRLNDKEIVEYEIKTCDRDIFDASMVADMSAFVVAVGTATSLVLSLVAIILKRPSYIPISMMGCLTPAAIVYAISLAKKIRNKSLRERLLERLDELNEQVISSACAKSNKESEKNA